MLMLDSPAGPKLIQSAATDTRTRMSASFRILDLNTETSFLTGLEPSMDDSGEEKVPRVVLFSLP